MEYLKRSGCMRRLWYFAGLLGATLCTSGCNFREDKGTDNETAITVDGSTPIFFEDVRSQIFEPACYGCHAAETGNAAGVNLETYAAVKTRLGRIKSSTVDSTRMPLGGKLSKNQVALLQFWIAAGAPETANQ